MLKEASSEKGKKALKERIKDIILELIGIAFLIGFLFLVLYLLYLFVQIWNDREEMIIWNDSSLTVVECRYPLGSIFNKDEIAIGSKGLVITTRSFWGSNIKTIPYSKVKQIEFAEGMYWHSFTVKREGIWRNRDTIYFKENLTKNTIKNFVIAVAPEMIIIEKQTVFYMFRKYLEQPSKKKRESRDTSK